jgi:hypothetical protein
MDHPCSGCSASVAQFFECTRCMYDGASVVNMLHLAVAEVHA